MKFLNIVILLAAVTVGLASESNSELKINSLSELQWQKRILIIKTNEKEIEATKSILAEYDDAIVERHMVWFLINGEDIESNVYLEVNKDFYNEINSVLNKSSVVLIGKDGSVKLKDEKLNLNIVFSKIDTMPMRRREMRE